MTLFSIITVTKDNLGGLQNTWKSIEKQSFNDYEWIVIDGGSSDKTTNFLKTTPARWISENDAGIYHAMNKGLGLAIGNNVLFLNAGDMLVNEDTLAAFAETKSDFIYGDSYETIDSKNHYKPARKPDISRGMFTHHQAMIYKWGAIDDLRFNTDYKIAADYDFTARFLQKTKNISYIPVPLCIFESGGVSQTRAEWGRKEEFKIRRTLNLTSLPSAAAIYIRQTLAWKFRQIAPELYWALKSSRNTAHDSAQNQTPHARPENPASKHSNDQTQKAA